MDDAARAPFLPLWTLFLARVIVLSCGPALVVHVAGGVARIKQVF
jgi:hypothetical protein